MMNKVFLVGRITRDLELRQTASGHPYVFFTVAVNRLPSANGERVADFISCVAWNRQAENLSRFIRKGGLVGIDGKIQTRTATNPDGTNRTIMEVVCDNISFLESKNANEPQSAGYDNYYGGNQNNNRPQYNNNGYNNNYSNNNYNNNSYYQPNQPSAPRNQEPVNENPFAGEVKSQFDISDDDLPF